KIAKKFAGKPGPVGPQGPAGAQGAPGKDGAPGAPGSAGTNGKSVVSGQETPGSNCAEGGYWFELQGSGSKQYVCDGAAGGSGPLGPGETQTGLWSFSAEVTHPYATINYPRPVETFNNIVWVGVGETP